MKGKTQQAAGAASGMSERSVRNWSKGPLPSEKKKDMRRQRTRPDPLAGVWEQDIEPLLRCGHRGSAQCADCSGVAGRAASGAVRQVASAHIAATDEGLARAARP